MGLAFAGFSMYLGLEPQRPLATTAVRLGISTPSSATSPATRSRETTRLGMQKYRIRCEQLTPNAPLQDAGFEGVSVLAGMETADICKMAS